MPQCLLLFFTPVLCLLILFQTEAYSPAILIANKTGVFYQNLSTGYSGTIITYSFGASYVDYKGEKEIYAILKSTKAEYYRIVRVLSTTYTNNNTQESCSTESLPLWCYNDELCQEMCAHSEFGNLSEVVKLTNCRFASNLAVDWVNDNIYWTCQIPLSSVSINRATTGGMGKKSLKTLGYSKILDMKIDPYARKLFWLKANLTSKTVKLITSNLDGEDERVVYSVETTPEAKLVLDIHNQKVYLIRDGNRSLNMDYEGADAIYVKSNSLIEFVDVRKLRNITRAKLYHPLLQTPEIHCPKHPCSSDCSLLTWKGLECYNSVNNFSEAETHTDNGYVQTTTIENTEATGVYTVTVKGLVSTNHTEDDVSTDTVKGLVSTNHTADDVSTDTVKGLVSTNHTEDDVSTDTVKGLVSTNHTEDDVSTAAEPISSAASSSGRLAVILIVLITIWVSIILVGLVIKRKVYTGNYRPASADGLFRTQT